MTKHRYYGMTVIVDNGRVLWGIKNRTCAGVEVLYDEPESPVSYFIPAEVMYREKLTVAEFRRLAKAGKVRLAI